MEFLIRTEDKINPQTWCNNPVHGGERVVFIDNTFQGPCPKCGQKQYLYRKNNAITKKGNFICFEPDGFEWGKLEKKHYGIIRISGITYDRAKELCSSNRILLSNHPTKQAKNQSQINYRSRKYKFDYENCIPLKIKKTWENRNVESEIFEMKKENKSFIKKYGFN